MFELYLIFMNLLATSLRNCVAVISQDAPEVMATWQRQMQFGTDTFSIKKELGHIVRRSSLCCIRLGGRYTFHSFFFVFHILLSVTGRINGLMLQPPHAVMTLLPRHCSHVHQVTFGDTYHAAPLRLHVVMDSFGTFSRCNPDFMLTMYCNLD